MYYCPKDRTWKEGKLSGESWRCKGKITGERGRMPSPQPFKNRPSRVCPLSHPSQALPYPIPRLLSRPRCAWRWGALAGLPQRAGHADRAMDGVWPPVGGAGGRAAGVAAPKGRLIFLSPQEFGVAISLPVVHNATLAIVKIVHRRLRFLT
jgi:hypothetical protein